MTFFERAHSWDIAKLSWKLKNKKELEKDGRKKIKYGERLYRFWRASTSGLFTPNGNETHLMEKEQSVDHESIEKFAPSNKKKKKSQQEKERDKLIRSVTVFYFYLATSW